MNLSSFKENEKSILSKQTKMQLVTFLNPYSYYKIKDYSLGDKFDYMFPDAISLVLLNNFLTRKKIERASFDFTSLAPIIFNYCKSNNLKVGIFGGDENEILAAKSEITKRFGSIIGVCHHGYFDLEELEVYDLINNNNIDVIVSSMGTPKQELFLLSVKKYCPEVSLGFTSGGFVSQIADKPEYFNKKLSKFNLRWLQRAIRHRYVRQRLLKDYPKFLIRYLWDFSKK